MEGAEIRNASLDSDALLVKAKGNSKDEL